MPPTTVTFAAPTVHSFLFQKPQKQKQQWKIRNVLKTTMGQENKTPPPPSQLLFLYWNENPLKWGFCYFSAPRQKLTNKQLLFFLTNGYTWLTLTQNNENLSLPSTHRTCNGPGNLIRKQKDIMLHKTMLVLFLVFLLFCYFYVKSLILKALSLSPSISGFCLYHLQEWFLSLW